MKQECKHIAIIGSGPAAMMLAAELDPVKYKVTIYEKNKAPARKFLVAGQGGFNLTHSEPIEEMMKRYIPFTFLEDALRSFDNIRLRRWLASIGIETYVGSSGRVFPNKGIKPVEVLASILALLEKRGVRLNYLQEWKGWSEQSELLFNNSGREEKVQPEITVLALGGASWPVTGSDGSWAGILRKQGILVKEFEASNCTFNVSWNKSLPDSLWGSPLKNCVFSCDGMSRKGEAVITRNGIEGSGVYPLSPSIRNALAVKGYANLYVDFKPDLSLEEVYRRLSASNTSLTRKLVESLKLGRIQVMLLKEALTKETFTDKKKLAENIKSFAFCITSSGPVDDAISTVGGVPTEELSPNFELKKMPSVFCIGEMLDWDAPTGGYLLQGCFSMGYYLAHYLNHIK